MFDWSVYKGNHTWLPAQTIYLTRYGSHAYGTNIPGSDLDLRGVCVAPRSVLLGFSEKFEHAEQHEPDIMIFELRKFMRFAADCNPNVLEVLYTDEADILQISPMGQVLRDNRDLFLSKRAKNTFLGFANSQARRIERHYQWVHNPPKCAPTRSDFGLPNRTTIPADQLAAAQALVEKRLLQWSWDQIEGLDSSTAYEVRKLFEQRLVEITAWKETDLQGKLWKVAAQIEGFDTNFLELLDRERQYASKQREWGNYKSWLDNRNKGRAEIEAKYGYDLKFGYHTVRLLRMCREILTTGQVLVKRPDASELLAIRSGAWSYEQLTNWVSAQNQEVNLLAKTSSLPNQPDLQKLEDLCIQITEDSM